MLTLSVSMLIVTAWSNMLSVIMLNVIMLNVIMLNVAFYTIFYCYSECHCVECCYASVVILHVVMLSVVEPNYD